MYWGTGTGSFGGATIQFTAPVCQRCSHPEAVVLRKPELARRLREARKLTHPDVCASPAATEVTQWLNAMIEHLEK